MKQVMRFLWIGEWYSTALCAFFVLIGGVFPPILATWFAGLSAYNSLRSDSISGWEMTSLIMPVCRKKSVLARYVRGIGMALMIGFLYILRFQLSYMGQLDGYAFLLCGVALVITAISLPIGYADAPTSPNSWRNTMVNFIAIFVGTLAPLRNGVSDNWVLLEREPVYMGTGLIWLAVGVAAIAVSLPVSLRLEAQREW